MLPRLRGLVVVQVALEGSDQHPSVSGGPQPVVELAGVTGAGHGDEDRDEPLGDTNPVLLRPVSLGPEVKPVPECRKIRSRSEW